MRQTGSPKRTEPPSLGKKKKVSVKLFPEARGLVSPPLPASVARMDPSVDLRQAFMGLTSEGKSFPVLGVGGGTLTLGGL